MSVYLLPVRHRPIALPELGGYFVVHRHDEGVACWDGERDRGCSYQPNLLTKLRRWVGEWL